MFEVISAGSPASLDALADAQLILLDMGEGLVVPDLQISEGETKWVARPGVSDFLMHYHKKEKPFVVFSDWDRDRVRGLVQELGWGDYLRLIFVGAEHVGHRHIYDAEGEKVVRSGHQKTLGRAFGHFRPFPHQRVFIGVESDVNVFSCETYDTPLIVIPKEALDQSLEARFSFRKLYR